MINISFAIWLAKISFLIDSWVSQVVVLTQKEDG